MHLLEVSRGSYGRSERHDAQHQRCKLPSSEHPPLQRSAQRIGLLALRNTAQSKKWISCG
jgi:hypothetical protein